jgi:ubiquinone/menaquinone biosynthesis C-methylase UbiE
MKQRFEEFKNYIEKFDNIADLGIGKGYYYEGVKGKNIVGIDLNEKNLAKLKTHSPEIKTFVRDVSDTQLPDSTYDLVILSQIIEHIKDYEPVLKEAKRICKSGGYFLIGTPIEDHHKLHFHPIWTEEDMKELGKKMGETITIKRLENSWLLYVRNVVVPEGTEDEPLEESIEEIKDYVSVIFVHWSQNEERSAISKASLKSLQNTIHIPAEIIVVDNGNSLEDSQFFLKECQEKRIALYIRNADNLHFSYARNQAMPEATGKWIAIVDNDIIYRDHWLELGIKAINAFPDKKLIYSPINYPYVHKRDPRWRHGQLEVKGRHFNLTERAGSNCMLMKRETFEEMGKFTLKRKSGGIYTDRLLNAGYLVITPAINWAFDAGLRKGFNFREEFIIKRTLSDGKNINLN